MVESELDAHAVSAEPVCPLLGDRRIGQRATISWTPEMIDQGLAVRIRHQSTAPRSCRGRYGGNRAATSRVSKPPAPNPASQDESTVKPASNRGNTRSNTVAREKRDRKSTRLNSSHSQ